MDIEALKRRISSYRTNIHQNGGLVVRSSTAHYT